MIEARPTPNQKLRYERERRGWSQQEVADKVGTTPLNVGRWERGVTLPGPHFRLKLSEVFEKSLYELGLVAEPPAAFLSSEPVPTPDRTTAGREIHGPLWNVPYNRNFFFTGRKDILTHLHDSFLNDEQPVAVTQPQAMSGLGGIGKTQTAVEYAYRYRDSYDAIFWARAESPDLLSSDFLLIAALLNLPQRNEQEQSAVVKAVLRWFDTHDRWLLILDNADHLKEVSEFIPSSGKGHVLLTTRAHSTGTIAQQIEIEKMDLDEGILFFLRRMKRLKGDIGIESVSETMRKQAQEIVEMVDGLPLALDQAGAYIEETGCSLSDYLKLYKTRHNRLLRIRGRDATGHPEPVATTWSLSFEKVERANPAAAELLRLCAFLHPDEIPEAMIIDGISQLGPSLGFLAEDELEMNEAIGELRKYSLVKRDSEKKILNLHRLVQVTIRDGMDKETQKTWAERAVKIVNEAFPEVEFATWEKCQQYSVHAQMCQGFIRQWQLAFPEASDLLKKVGNYFVERARYNEAEQLLKQALAIREQMQKQSHPDLAQSLHDLAVLYYIQGKYEEGEELHRRALALRENIFGPEHADVAQSLNNLARLYSEQGKDELAEPLFLRAIAIQEQVLGAEHHSLSATLNNLAFLYYRFRGRFQEAEPLLQRVVAINEHNLGPEHPNTAAALHRLGEFYYRFRGRFQEAEPLLQRSLAIYERNLGPDHPGTATVLDDLGDLYRFQGRYQEAEPLLQRSLAIYERNLGPDHFHTSGPLHNLALLYTLQGRYQEAELLFQQALAIEEQSVGLNHPDTATSLLSLAFLYKNQQRYQEAELLYLRALHIWEQALGSEHTDVSYSLNGLANLYTEQDKYEQAEALYLRALHIWEQSLGSEHHQVGTALKGLANLHVKQGRYEQAEALYLRALHIWEQSLGFEHHYVANALNDLANLHAKQGRYEQAKALYQRALTIRQYQRGPQHLETAETLHDSARLHELQKQPEEALKLYLQALAIREQQLGPQHPCTVDTRTRVAQLLRESGRVEEATALEAILIQQATTSDQPAS